MVWVLHLVNQWSDLRGDFSNFSWKMRCKWFFRNESQKNIIETSVFSIKSTGNTDNGASTHKLFLSQTNSELIIPNCTFTNSKVHFLKYTKRSAISNFRNLYWKSFRNFKSQFTIYNETWRIIYTRHRHFFSNKSP